MCGIFGYIGKKNAAEVSLQGLKKLEYRGYDSAGIAGVVDHKLVFLKEVGKIAALEKEVEKQHLFLPVAIAHSRWATHGKPSKANAHPHIDMGGTLAIVHNGIIENHEVLRRSLQKKGIVFQSDTDTEVIAHLISSFYEKDLLKAVQQTVPLLKGAFAIAVVHADFPRQIVAVAHQSPLVIGLGEGETFISSDSHAFASHTQHVIYLANSEIAVVEAKGVHIYNADEKLIDKQVETLDIKLEEVSKGQYEHYTLKEIFEQSEVIKNCLLSRFDEDYGTAIFEDAHFDTDELSRIERILILGCGTSYHAGCIGAYLLEDLARIPAQVEISSEFRYKNPIVSKGTYVIAISQSGETADTIAAMREVKAKGAKVLALCNVAASTLVRDADACIYLKAGPEIGVCSTKAFTSQVVVLALFTLMMARMRHMGKEEGQQFLKALKQLPDQVRQVLDSAPVIKAIAKKYAKHEDFFFIGRRYMYPASLEGALKLKEISYINANGYAAGELKHGPIALLSPDCPVVALSADRMTHEKLVSNIMEVKARKAPVIAIAEEGDEEVKHLADDTIFVPSTLDALAPLPTAIANQLLAYYIAEERGEDIDQPRNLAKSVTVE